MKHWKLKAVLATLLVFTLYVVFQHPNLNPLYPESVSYTHLDVYKRQESVQTDPAKP